MSRIPGENYRSAEIDRLNQIMIDGNICVSDVIGSNINAKIPWICEGFEWSIKTCSRIQSLKITCYTVKFKTGGMFEYGYLTKCLILKLSKASI